MKATLTVSQTNRNSVTGRSLIRPVALWTLQVLLALLFIFAGSMKFLIPTAVMAAQMTVPLPGWFILFIGVAECAGALGLLLPGLLRIKRGLTPLAACGLVLIMIGATIVTLIGGEIVPALFPLVVGLLCAIVACARASWARAA